jgi:hypothetical protein
VEAAILTLRDGTRTETQVACGAADRTVRERGEEP